MQITMRPMTADEAWQYLLVRYDKFKDLKKFGYGFEMWMPDLEAIKEMFTKPVLTDADKTGYEKIFRLYYDEKHLRVFDDVFNKDIKQKLESAITKYLEPLLGVWNTKLPNSLEILCAYGRGGSYGMPDKNNHASITLRVSSMKQDPQGVFYVLFHEFVHLLIQKPIIEKYHVPQDLKERIVDIICLNFVNMPVQPRFKESFANNYINLDVIKNNLPKAVEKMMMDYNALNKQTQNSKD